MQLKVSIQGQETREYRLEDFLVYRRTFVTVGRGSEAVHNCIAIGSVEVDEFQCQLVQDSEGGWMVRRGQLRTECPRGLRSDRQVACNTCTGRCVNVRPGRPDYSWRRPEVPVFLDGVEVLDEYIPLHSGSRLTFGDAVLQFE